MTARRLRIHGRVQGVFYRDWTRDTARTLGLSGWVRNRSDGTVEAHLEGDANQITEMIGHCRKGPPAASVERVDVEDCAEEGLSGFEKRRTA